MRHFVDPQPDEDFVVACIPVPLVPVTCGILHLLEHRWAWATDDDHRKGYQWVVELQANLMRCKLGEKLDKIYRLLDGALLGATYTVVSLDPLETNPVIPPVPNLAAAVEPGLVMRLKRLEYLLDNSMNGTVTPVWAATPGVRAKLQEIIDTLAAQGQMDDDMLAQLIQIVALLA